MNIEEKCKSYGFKDKELFEKTLNAFSLLSTLSGVFPDMIFKGGTSVFLRTMNPIRLSIDIDILLQESDKENLDEKLNGVNEQSSIFKLCEENKRLSTLDKKHYKFFYDSEFGKADQYILLDIVFIENPYNKLEKRELKSHGMLNEMLGTVNIPTAEGLFADKLVAIASGNLGIDYMKGKEIEFVKQLIDLGILYDELSDIKDVRATFHSIISAENDLHGSTYEMTEIIEDIEKTALLYCSFLMKGNTNDVEKAEKIDAGLRRIGNHLMRKYTREDVKKIFAQIVYVLDLIKTEQNGPIINALDEKLTAGKTLGGEYAVLNRMQKTNKEAFFFWCYTKGIKQEEDN